MKLSSKHSMHLQQCVFTANAINKRACKTIGHWMDDKEHEQNDD